MREYPVDILLRERQQARERQRRHRAIEHYAHVEMPLFDVTERTDWIERRLALLDDIRRRQHRGVGW